MTLAKKIWRLERTCLVRRKATTVALPVVHVYVQKEMSPYMLSECAGRIQQWLDRLLKWFRKPENTIYYTVQALLACFMSKPRQHGLF